jgi:hypothetical protein
LCIFVTNPETEQFEHEKRAKKESGKHTERMYAYAEHLEEILQTEKEKEDMMSRASNDVAGQTLHEVLSVPIGKSPSEIASPVAKQQCTGGKDPSTTKPVEVTPSRNNQKTTPLDEESTKASMDSCIPQEIATAADIASSLASIKEDTITSPYNVSMTWIIGVQNNTIQSSRGGGRCMQDAVKNSTPLMCQGKKEESDE